MYPACLMDYHIHTTFSPDGHQTVMEACARAVELGLKEIAITDHIDGPLYPNEPVFDIVDPAAYRRAIEEARKAFPQLTVLRGVELAYFEPFWPQALRRLQEIEPDYVLGSFHAARGMDPAEPLYFMGRSRRDAYLAYLDTVEDGLDHLLPHIHTFAHFDYVSKFSPYTCLEYRDAGAQIDRILRTLAGSGIALEINTSGLRRGIQPLPGYDLAQRYLAMGGVCLAMGSDAHYSEHMAGHYGDVEAKLQALSGDGLAGRYCPHTRRWYRDAGLV